MADDELVDQEHDPTLKPKESAAWLNLIRDAETAFRDWQDRCDNIDALYADLKKLAADNRDRQFQIFWANIQVLGPSTYSRPPVPVAVPRFKDRKPLPRAASELLERACVVTFDMEDIDQIMRLVRDDLNINGRGVPWLRYEASEADEDEVEHVCIEHLDRKDFLHEPARKWKEVGWVARRAWMTREEMKERFPKVDTGNVAFEVRKDDKENGAADPRPKAGIWEIWSKAERKVVWVTDGVEEVLDSQDPFLKLEGFYPCPKPAYSTVQRRSLIPVPDMAYYRDQLEEINELTARISSLSESVKVRGFYPAGASEVGEAVEAAIKSTSNNQILVGISNWALVGGGAAKDMIVWLPIDMIVTTIGELVTLRKQLIEDVYQITGLSDIMRGATDPNETLGAQELKSQYGSVRVRDRQAELVRIARDVTRIAAEIMAENFSAKTFLEMSQLELPTDADIAKQVAAMKQQAQQIMAQAEQGGDPQAGEQAKAQVDVMGKQAQKLQEQPTIDKVMALFRSERLRPFVLDIETDSTIQPDEDAEKQRRTEFLTALGTAMKELAPLVGTQPQAAPFAGAVLKFVTAPYRAGRELEQAIDEFVDSMSAQAQQPKPNPEEEKLKAEMQLKGADMQIRQQETQQKGQLAQADIKTKLTLAMVDAKNKQAEGQQKLADLAATRKEKAEAHQQAMQKGALELEKLKLEIAAMATPEAPAPVEQKPPSESIAFKDLPPEGQAQMAAQAGIQLSPEQMAQHQAAQDAKEAAKLAAKKQPEPA